MKQESDEFERLVYKKFEDVRLSLASSQQEIQATQSRIPPINKEIKELQQSRLYISEFQLFKN